MFLQWRPQWAETTTHVVHEPHNSDGDNNAAKTATYVISKPLSFFMLARMMATTKGTILCAITNVTLWQQQSYRVAQWRRQQNQ